MTPTQKNRSTTARRPAVVSVTVAIAAAIALVVSSTNQTPDADARERSRDTPSATTVVVSPAAHDAETQRLVDLGERAAAERRERFFVAVDTAQRAERFFAAAAAAEAEAARVAAEEAAAARAAAAASTSASSTSSGSGGMGGGWAALRNCESGGNYSAVSSSGAYRGAYQFSQSTWNAVASRSNPSLVGVDPAAASPASQDAMARALYNSSGSSPWPHCGRHL